MAVFAVAFLLFLYLGMPSLVMAIANRTTLHRPYPASEKARALYAKLFVADMHCDALLWSRDLTKKSTWGHVDIPRMIENHVGLQIFDAVTSVPIDGNVRLTYNVCDVIEPLVFFQGWPARTWFSTRERALYIAERLSKTSERMHGALKIIHTREDLERYVAERATNPNITAGLLGVEGLHCLEGDARNVRVLFDAGYRLMGLAHFIDNAVGGSAHGAEKGGLTPFGREVVRMIEELQGIVDLAHASPKLVEDTLAVSTRPVVVSHTGLCGVCDNRRNLTDDQARGVAEKGGLIGIGFWPHVHCGRGVAGIVETIQYAVNLVGADHVALGSDFDGAVSAPFDVSGLPMLADKLLDAGLSEDTVSKVMGGNELRFLLGNLPGEQGVGKS
jgi:microsomal dipeptidase-like Zn-dependent dipeptidase